MSWGLRTQLISDSLGDRKTILEGFSFYQPPNNTAGSMVIPIAMCPQPVAFVTVRVKKDTMVILRATVGWRTTEGTLDDNGITDGIAALFKIWRDTPVTGTMLCGVKESCAAGNCTVTSFEHVDGLPANNGPGQITYTLTAQQLNQSGMTAEITGCLTFTALCITREQP